MSKDAMITQTEHGRVSIQVDDDGVRITQARFVTQGRIGAPSESVWLTKQEFAKIAGKCKGTWTPSTKSKVKA